MAVTEAVVGPLDWADVTVGAPAGDVVITPMAEGGLVVPLAATAVTCGQPGHRVQRCEYTNFESNITGGIDYASAVFPITDESKTGMQPQRRVLCTSDV